MTSHKESLYLTRLRQSPRKSCLPELRKKTTVRAPTSKLLQSMVMMCHHPSWHRTSEVYIPPWLKWYTQRKSQGHITPHPSLQLKSWHRATKEEEACSKTKRKQPLPWAFAQLRELIKKSHQPQTEGKHLEKFPRHLGAESTQGRSHYLQWR